MQKKALGLFVFSFLGATLNAWSMSDHGSDLESGAGIAKPSITSSRFQNPAGLGYTRGAYFNPFVEFHGDKFDDNVFGGALLYGNGSFGVMGGVYGDPGTGYAGLAVHPSDVNTSFGITAHRGLKYEGDFFNAGLIVDLSASLHLGATVMNFTDNSRSIGIGAAYYLSPSLVMTLDAAGTDGFSQPWLQPGFELRTFSAALAVSYGMPTDAANAHAPQITDGIDVGGELSFGRGSAVSVHYRDSGYAAELKLAL